MFKMIKNHWIEVTNNMISGRFVKFYVLFYKKGETNFGNEDTKHSSIKQA